MDQSWGEMNTKLQVEEYSYWHWIRFSLFWTYGSSHISIKYKAERKTKWHEAIQTSAWTDQLFNVN